MNIKNLVNDAYAKDISAKGRAAKRIAQKNGEYVGAVAPYGYRCEKVHGIYKLIVEPEAAKIVRRILKRMRQVWGFNVLLMICLRMEYIGFQTITDIIMCTVRKEKNCISGQCLPCVRY